MYMKGKEKPARFKRKLFLLYSKELIPSRAGQSGQRNVSPSGVLFRSKFLKSLQTAAMKTDFRCSVRVQTTGHDPRSPFGEHNAPICIYYNRTLMCLQLKWPDLYTLMVPESEKPVVFISPFLP